MKKGTAREFFQCNRCGVNFNAPIRVGGRRVCPKCQSPKWADPPKWDGEPTQVGPPADPGSRDPKAPAPLG